MRLDKFLCDAVNISRKDAKDFIKKGVVSVNGTKITDSGFNVSEAADTVLFKEKPIIYEKFVYYMLNKPAGVVSATIEANSVRAAAMQYTDDLLANLEKIITHTTQTTVANYNELISNLNSCNGIVKENRTELHPSDEDDLENIALGNDDGLDDNLEIM